MKCSNLVGIALATLAVPHDVQATAHGGFGRSGFAMMPPMRFGEQIGHFQGFRDRGPGQEQGNPFFDSGGRPYGNPLETTLAPMAVQMPRNAPR
jgi:hypothetical protein